MSKQESRMYVRVYEYYDQAECDENANYEW